MALARRWLPALVLVPIVIGACVAGLRWDTTAPVVRRDDRWYPATERYAGSEACAGCHDALLQEHAKSAHARTVRRLGRGKGRVSNPGGPGVKDPLTGALYRVEARGDRDQIVLNAGDRSAAADLEWEFGSGNHAHGYLARLEDGSYVDCRLNWYRQPGKWDFASGQDKPTRTLLESPLGRPINQGQLNRCFSCHATALRASQRIQPGVTQEEIKLVPDRSVAGVQCEGCHGPRAAHVAAFRDRKPTPRPPQLSAKEINTLCAECHSRSDLDPNHAVVSRFQPWGLERSRCYQASSGRLSCLTCHDPHADAVTDPGYYNTRCLSCHSPAAVAKKEARATCKAGQKDRCVSCHMPRDDEGMLHVTFTDHRIRVVRGAE